MTGSPQLNRLPNELQAMIWEVTLEPRNVVIAWIQRHLPDDTIVAVIDWAFAGWYPKCREFTKAHYVLGAEADDWRDNVRKALPRYETGAGGRADLLGRIARARDPNTAASQGRRSYGAPRLISLGDLVGGQAETTHR